MIAGLPCGIPAMLKSVESARALTQDATGSYNHLKASLVAENKALMLPGEPCGLVSTNPIE